MTSSVRIHDNSEPVFEHHQRPDGILAIRLAGTVLGKQPFDPFPADDTSGKRSCIEEDISAVSGKIMPEPVIQR